MRMVQSQMLAVEQGEVTQGKKNKTSQHSRNTPFKLANLISSPLGTQNCLFHSKNGFKHSILNFRPCNPVCGSPQGWPGHK